MDTSAQFMAEDEMFYALNHDILTPTANQRATPLPANYLGCDIELPAGDNYIIGSHNAKQTNEIYVFVANTNNAHFIYRINGDSTCEIVNDSPCLQSVFGVTPEVFNPKHSFEDWRVMLRVEKICQNRHGKELIFTNGLGNIGCIDVEASINTDSFSTPFFERCAVDCETVELCVPDTCGCITAEFLPLADEERGLTNNIVDVGFKFMARPVYYDLRAGEWSAMSSLYYQSSNGCFSNTFGFPRCMELTVPLYNPLVEKIEIAYSTDNGVNWLLYDTIEKYESYNSSVTLWYDRELNPDLELTEDECHIKVRFCNDKQCQPVNAGDVSRVFNPSAYKPQGFVQIKEVLGWYNFEAGVCPLNRDEIAKFEVNANCDATDDCTPEYVDVTVRAIVHCFYYGGFNTPIVRGGGTEGYGFPDDVNDPAAFSLERPAVGTIIRPAYRGIFAAKKRNFTAYIENEEGSAVFSEMKQWTAENGFLNREEKGIASGANKEGTNPGGYFAYALSGYAYQETTFKVRKGTKGFIRLMSHESATNTTNTSTFIKGTLNDIATYTKTGVVQDQPSFNEYKTEIYFDTTGGAVDLMECFIIENPAKASNIDNHSAAFFFGYLKLQDGTPLELAEFWREPDRWMRTDHNGFFFRGFDEIPSDPEFDVRVETNCVGGFNTIKEVTLLGQYGGATQTDITVLDTDTEDYRDIFVADAQVKVLDCDGEPVGGVSIAMSNSKARATGADGIAYFRLRNTSSRNRSARAVLMGKDGCYIYDCLSYYCNTSNPSQEVLTPACYSSTSGALEVVFANMVINTEDGASASRGLKKGGTYQFAVFAKGKCGKISAAYELSSDIKIPKLQDGGILNFCTFSYNANNIQLPEWVDCLEIVRTENLSPFVLQWVVDKVERINGKLRLTIQSLNDYNADHTFKTNSIYKYLDGDRIEFIRNGDGTIFDIATYGLLNFATLSPFNSTDNVTADYFNQLLLEDSNKLSGLTKGAVIEIQRQKECTTEPAYHSICVSLEVVDGQVVNQTGSFHTFDTYLVQRRVGEFGVNVFEHHSPSDFWGEKFSDTGKAYFVNKYENEKRYGRAIILTYADEFNRFDSNLMKILDSPEHGDITAMRVVDSSIIQAISEHDNSISQIADDLMRIGSDGIARASRPDQIISDGQPKVSGRYGCRYNSIGSIYFGDGFTTFVDISKAAYVKHDFNIGVDVSLMRTKSWFKKKCVLMQSINTVDNEYFAHYRFITGQNKLDDRIYLTIKSFEHSGINNSIEPYVLPNETIMYHPVMNEWLGFASFTPEAYSQIDITEDSGCAFVCFLNALPYFTPAIPTEWNTFFGTSCDWIFSISMNKYPEKIKRGLNIEVQDARQLWYAKKVETEELNWISEIVPADVKRNEDLVSMAFYANKNSSKGLRGDDLPRGFFHKVTMIRENTVAQKYSEISPDNQKKYSELGLVIFRFAMSEQSGLPVK